MAPQPTLLPPHLINDLADRLRARGEGAMLRSMPQLQADLLLASRLLRQMLRDGTIYRPIEVEP